MAISQNQIKNYHKIPPFKSKPKSTIPNTRTGSKISLGLKMWLNGEIQAQNSNIQLIEASDALQEWSQSAQQQIDEKYV